MATGAAVGTYPLTHNKPRNYSINLDCRRKLRDPHSIACRAMLFAHAKSHNVLEGCTAALSIAY